jgi:hypothetical protein
MSNRHESCEGEEIKNGMTGWINPPRSSGRVQEGERLRRQSSMRTVMGDIVKSKSTGEFYKVKRIKEPVILLEAENVPNKLWLGNKESLELLYDKVENLEQQDLNAAV